MREDGLVQAASHSSEANRRAHSFLIYGFLCSIVTPKRFNAGVYDMKYTFYVLGGVLILVGVIQMIENPHMDFLMSLANIAALVLGGTLLHRARTNNPLFGKNLMARISAMPSERKRNGLFSVILFALSGMIPLLGIKSLLGYNDSASIQPAILCVLLGLAGAFFLWRFLKHLRKDRPVGC